MLFKEPFEGTSEAYDDMLTEEAAVESARRVSHTEGAVTSYRMEEDIAHEMGCSEDGIEEWLGTHHDVLIEILSNDAELRAKYGKSESKKEFYSEVIRRLNLRAH